MVAIALGYLLLRFGQAIAKFLLALGGLIVAGIIALAFLEQARATRAVAATATVAATGQAATSASLAAVVLILFILLAAGGVAAYLYFRHRRQRARAAWLPGPYAYWGQQPPALSQQVQPAAQYPPAQPAAQYPSIPPAYYPAIPPAPVVYPLYWVYPPDPSPYPAMPEEDEDERLAALSWW